MYGEKEYFEKEDFFFFCEVKMAIKISSQNHKNKRIDSHYQINKEHET